MLTRSLLGSTPTCSVVRGRLQRLGHPCGLRRQFAPIQPAGRLRNCSTAKSQNGESAGAQQQVPGQEHNTGARNSGSSSPAEHHSKHDGHQHDSKHGGHHHDGAHGAAHQLQHRAAEKMTFQLLEKVAERMTERVGERVTERLTERVGERVSTQGCLLKHVCACGQLQHSSSGRCICCPPPPSGSTANMQSLPVLQWHPGCGSCALPA